MKKLLISFVFSFILVFSFSLNVSAECSYKERTQLLNEANKIEIFFEPAEKIENVTVVNPNSGEQSIVEEKTVYIKMNFVNISENIFVKVTNMSSNETFVINSASFINGIYTLDLMDVENIIDYSVAFYSNNNNCYANKINSKTYKKPRINFISEYSICKNKLVADSKYCKRFIDTEFSMDEVEIVEYLNRKINETNQITDVPVTEVTFIGLLKTYWYVPTIIGVFIVFGIIFVIVKKRGELK